MTRIRTLYFILSLIIIFPNYTYLLSPSLSPYLTDSTLRHAIYQILLTGSSSHGPPSSWNTSSITNLRKLLHPLNNQKYNIKFTYNISSWDVSRVTDMSFMMTNAKLFNCDLNMWNVSQVTDMSYAFSACHRFNSQLCYWDVSRVTSMMGMFRYNKHFYQDLSMWNVSRVNDMSYMFYGTTKYNGDMSQWDVSNLSYRISMMEGSKSYRRYLGWGLDNIQYDWGMWRESSWKEVTKDGCDDKNRKVVVE